MARTLDLTNQSFYQGLVQEPCLDINADGVLPVRFPLADSSLLHPDLLDKMKEPSGVSLMFDTDATVCKLRYRFGAEGLASCTKRAFPPGMALLPAETLPLHQPITFDLFVNGVFFTRKTNNPPIKGFSVDDFFLPTTPKPIDNPMLNFIPKLMELQEQFQKIPPEEWRRHAEGEISFEGLPAGCKRLELYLPENVAVRLCSLSLEGSAGVDAVIDTRPLLVTYGSSITQGAPFANGPSSVWPVVAARAAGIRVVNLGAAGQCHFDQAMARLIRDTPAACFAFKMGINVHNLGSMSMRTFVDAAMGFILTVRDGHPTEPICVISPIWGGFREEQSWDVDVGLPFKAQCPSLTQMRQLLKSMVELLRSRGDTNLHYIDGLSLADEQMGKAMPDDLHPDGNCYEQIGLRFAELAFGPEGLLIPGRTSRDTGLSDKPQRPAASEFEAEQPETPAIQRSTRCLSALRAASSWCSCSF